MIKAKVAF